MNDYLDDELNYQPERFQAARYLRKTRDRKYVSDSINKLPNELREYVADDEDFNTRYSYPEDYLY
jgi:hypothetical protein